MARLIILVGPPGSGKSTEALELQDLGYIRINQDEQGKSGHLELFHKALMDGKNIVIDRMNFDKKQRARYLEPAKEAEYETVIKTLFVPYDICFSRCLDRANHPTISDFHSAKAALHTFFTKFERPTEDEADSIKFEYWSDSSVKKPECIIVDLDGTLCDAGHRTHFVRREGKKDWKAFYDGIADDKPNQWCLDIVTSLQSKYEIVFCSGRPEDYWQVTVSWLENYLSYREYLHLFMRFSKDSRKDYIIKEIILDFEILTRYTPVFAIDDRKQVVDLWRRRGITCLQCDEGDF